MILDLDTAKVLYLLESPNELKLVVDEAMDVLRNHPRLPLMLDSYMSTMCNESWGRSSYVRAMIKVHANVELKEFIVVAVPKLEGNGYTCETVTVEYEWKPPRCFNMQDFWSYARSMTSYCKGDAYQEGGK
nr:hypothetical protein [Tanacetum cinerariifolium]